MSKDVDYFNFKCNSCGDKLATIAIFLRKSFRQNEFKRFTIKCGCGATNDFYMQDVKPDFQSVQFQ